MATRILNRTDKRPTVLRRRELKATSTSPELPVEPVGVEPVNYGNGENMPIMEILDARVAETRRARNDDYTHVSDLTSKCTRKAALVSTLNIIMPVERLSLADSLVFRMGDAIHDVVKERMSASVPHKVWGRWKCKCGTYKTEEPSLLSEVDAGIFCDNCGKPATFYEEVSVVDEDLWMVGHPDLIVYMERHKALYITEIKSIAPKHFDELNGPRQEHVIQVLFYWFLMRRAGYRLIDQVSILYVSKGYMFKGSPYREFVLKPSTMMHRLDVFVAEARELKIARDGGPLPPRITCPVRESPEARKCPVAKQCFGEQLASIATVSVSQITRARSAPQKARLNPTTKRVGG